MYVRAVITPAVIQGGVLVPQQGITRDPKGNATAMVVGAEGTVERRAVEVSRTIGDQWLVEAGLAAGDRVVIAGLQKIQPGMPVRVTEDGAAPSGPASDAAAGAAEAAETGTPRGSNNPDDGDPGGR
jgi:membrane fusion protein (multidrug efflux system)